MWGCRSQREGQDKDADPRGGRRISLPMPGCPHWAAHRFMFYHDIPTVGMNPFRIYRMCRSCFDLTCSKAMGVDGHRELPGRTMSSIPESSVICHILPSLGLLTNIAKLYTQTYAIRVLYSGAFGFKL